MSFSNQYAFRAERIDSTLWSQIGDSRPKKIGSLDGQLIYPSEGKPYFVNFYNSTNIPLNDSNIPDRLAEIASESVEEMSLMRVKRFTTWLTLS